MFIVVIFYNYSQLDEDLSNTLCLVPLGNSHPSNTIHFYDFVYPSTSHAFALFGYNFNTFVHIFFIILAT